jgi:hypothetical protein
MTNADNIRAAWLRTYEQLEARGEALRDSQSVAFGLLDAYDRCSTEERGTIHTILAEWFLSEDNKRRYDASALSHLN